MAVVRSAHRLLAAFFFAIFTFAWTASWWLFNLKKMLLELRVLLWYESERQVIWPTVWRLRSSDSDGSFGKDAGLELLYRINRTKGYIFFLNFDILWWKILDITNYKFKTFPLQLCITSTICTVSSTSCDTFRSRSDLNSVVQPSAKPRGVIDGHCILIDVTFACE